MKFILKFKKKLSQFSDPSFDLKESIDTNACRITSVTVSISVQFVLFYTFNVKKNNNHELQFKQF